MRTEPKVNLPQDAWDPAFARVIPNLLLGGLDSMAMLTLQPSTAESEES